MAAIEANTRYAIEYKSASNVEATAMKTLTYAGPLLTGTITTRTPRAPVRRALFRDCSWLFRTVHPRNSVPERSEHPQKTVRGTLAALEWYHVHWLAFWLWMGADDGAAWCGESG